MEVLAMNIEWLRDLIIVINGIVSIGVLVFFALLAYSLYRRARPVLDTVSTISKLAAPVVALIQGIRQGVVTFSEFFSKK
jgi:hypothetical protein